MELRRVGEGKDVIIAYHGPAAGHPDSAALQVLAGIMSGGGGGRGGRGGGGGEGRLQKALVDTKIADSAGMSFRSLHDPGLVMLNANLNKDQSPDEARKALIAALEGIIANPPSKEETERVTTGLLRNLETSLSDPQAIATGALNEAIAQGDWRLMFLQHDRLKDVSPMDVVRVAKTYLKASNRTVGYYIPDAAPDGALLALLASHEMYDRTMKWDEQLEKRIEGLTPEQISAAFRKHVDAGSLSIVKAGDFKAAGVYQ